MTHITVSHTTSINRINYGISFQQLRPSKIVVAEFVYDFILALPYNPIIHRGETIPTCNTNTRNKNLTNSGHKTSHPNEPPHTVDCSTALYALMNTLYETDRDIHIEVNDLIMQINNELPREVKLSQRRSSRAWFKAIGSLLKTVFGTMDEDESNKINERLKILDRYTDDSTKTTRMEVGRLITGENILQAKVTDVLGELRESSMILTRGIESRTEYLAQELDWLSVFQSKAIKLLHNGKKLTHSLNNLLNGVQQLNNGKLSQDIVPHTTLLEAIQHVQQRITTHGNISMYMVTNDVRDLHRQAIVHHVHVKEHLIISLLILLTTNRREFMSYKIKKHDVAVPNSDIYTRLDTDVKYIAIERETMQYAYITELEANSLQIDNEYLLPKKIIYHADNQNCITSIYLNNHTAIKEHCKYIIVQKDRTPQVTQYDDSKFYLRNTVNYTVQCAVGNIYKRHANDYVNNTTAFKTAWSTLKTFTQT